MNLFGRAFLVAFPMLILLTSCSKAYTSEESLCIPPNVTTSYDLSLRRQDETSVSRRKPMPSWWQPQLGIFQRDNPILFAANAVATRSEDEIWIAGYPDSHGNTIVRFNASTHQITKYGVFDEAGKGFVADNLLVTSDGSLWARLTMLGTTPTYSALAKYDQATDQFALVTDLEGLLSPPTGGGIHNIFPRRSVLSQMPDGSLAVGLDGEIFTYIPSTNRAVRVLAHTSGLDAKAFAVSQDGHIWFVGGGDDSVREIDPASGSISNYGQPPGIRSRGTLRKHG